MIPIKHMIIINKQNAIKTHDNTYSLQRFKAVVIPQSKQGKQCLPKENQAKQNKCLYNQHYCHQKLFHMPFYLSSFENWEHIWHLSCSQNGVVDFELPRQLFQKCFDALTFELAIIMKS